MNAKDFCSCTDHKCPLHPVNHDKGCDLCIIKCLKKDEIPSCFFKKISLERPENEDYTFVGFSKFVEKHCKEEE
ncbi:DUF6485 family protein [Cetobacterium sp. ZWU0022]|uniref:DUF6485 family protein n=1 Tax=Cetobacterium sp. ZWU0022 TaxID=1340502 RepID=UPI0006459F8D|nr:DUF6485 family protein [Cetobacterium sp. ZWU0022]